MKINKLLNRPNTGIYAGRCTGKSTALALMYISNAMQNPGKTIYIKDHYGTLKADHFLFEIVREMVNKLRLEYMVLSKHCCTIRFDLYEEDDRYIEVNGDLYRKV